MIEYLPLAAPLAFGALLFYRHRVNAAADPCGYDRHDWTTWTEPQPYPGQFSTRIQYRTCQRCRKCDGRCF